MEAVLPSASGVTDYVEDNCRQRDFFPLASDYTLAEPETQVNGCNGMLDYISNEVYMDNASSADINETDYGMENGYGQDSLEDGCMEDGKPKSATERVLCQLDDVLRQKINFELETFRRSLHVMLNDQRSNLQHLLRLATIKNEDVKEERQIDDVIPLDYENDFHTTLCSSGNSPTQTEHDEKCIEFTDQEVPCQNSPSMNNLKAGWHPTWVRQYYISMVAKNIHACGMSSLQGQK